MSVELHEPTLIRSKHCQDVLVDGHRFSINIVFSSDHSGWCLEVIDEHSMSHAWATVFDTEDEALKAATVAFEDEGAAGFLQNFSTTP
jgi:hypothetical protein